MSRAILVLVVLVVVAIGGLFVVRERQSRGAGSGSAGQPKVSQPVPQSQQQTSQPSQVPSQTKPLEAQAIPGVHSDYVFSGEIPTSWQAEAVGAIEAINLFDPQSAGENNLEKSQIFIRKFVGNDFLTLTTVTIHSRQQLTINLRPAVRYEIEKKSGVANFANQPSWRSNRHIVTDIRSSDANPTVFYVIAKRSELSEQTYQQFLNSLTWASITNLSEPVTLIEPVSEFKQRITKKLFGIFITPETSPVQPERFSGFHTAVDVEYEDKPNVDIPVRSIADGVVALSTTATGYGGVLVIRHEIKGKARAVIYGHLDPASLPKLGATIKRGEQIGMLGEGNTKETDGERKHLHFGVRSDDDPNIKGYVTRKEELSGWQNPLELYQ